MNIQNEKNFFINFYSKGSPIRNSINAAVLGPIEKKKIFYSPEAKKPLKEEFKSFLQNEVTKMKPFFETSFTEKYFLEKVLILRDKVNSEFNNTNLFNLERKFTIGNSQKFLSLFLKYEWCTDQLPEPVICPVDRVMLKESKAPFKYQNWMSINTFDEYKVRYNYLKEAAFKANLTPAQYELIEFNNYKRKNAKNK